MEPAYPLGVTSTATTATTLAVLGCTLESPTCSMFEARRLCGTQREGGMLIQPIASFQEILCALRRGEVQRALIPGACPLVGEFLMAEEATLVRAYIRRIPALVVSGLAASPPQSVERLHFQPATRPMLTRMILAPRHLIEATSNEAAAQAAVNDADSAAITNEAAARAMGLFVYQTLRAPAPMPWLILEHTGRRH